MRYIGRYLNEEACQDALDSGILGTPYIAFLIEENRIDNNSLYSHLIPDNEIWYKTSDNSVITIDGGYIDKIYGAHLVSNTYDDTDGWCKAVFDGPVTQISPYSPGGSSDGVKVHFCDKENLTNIIVPPLCTKIGGYAQGFVRDAAGFCSGCTSLVEAYIPPSVTTIGACAFYNCGALQKIKIPNSVTTFDGGGIFKNCTGLEALKLPDNLTYMTEVSSFVAGTLFEHDFVVPDTVTTFTGTWITNNSDYDPRTLTIGKGVTDMYGFGFKYNTVENFTLVMKPITPPAIRDGVFYYFTSSTNKIIVPAAGLQNYLTAQTWSGVPNRITHDNIIPTNEIWYKTSDNNVIEIPESGETFYGANLVSNTYNTITGYCVAKFDDDVKMFGNSSGYNDFANKNTLTEIILPSTLSAIKASSSSSSGRYTGLYGCSNLQKIYIPEGVKFLGDYCFCNCSTLTKITLPSTCIGLWNYNIFRGCRSLTSINIPEGTTSIGTSTFRGCSSLTSITIPASVTYIGEAVFVIAEALTGYHFKGTTPPDIQSNSLYDVGNNRKIYVPASAVDIYKVATNFSQYASYIVAEPAA